MSQTALWEITAIKNYFRLKHNKENTQTYGSTTQSTHSQHPSVRSAQQNKLNSSSQLDGRIELINLSIPFLDHWTEPHCRVNARVHKGVATDVWVCLTHGMVLKAVVNSQRGPECRIFFL